MQYLCCGCGAVGVTCHDHIQAVERTVAHHARRAIVQLSLYLAVVQVVDNGNNLLATTRQRGVDFNLADVVLAIGWHQFASAARRIANRRLR